MANKKNPLVKSFQWRKNKGQFQYRMTGHNNRTIESSERYKNFTTMLKKIAKYQKCWPDYQVPVLERDSRWKPIKKK